MTADDAGITVVGIGRVGAAPDLMTIELGISPRAESVAEASATSADKTRAVLDSLVGSGVAAEDIRTVRYDINPEYDHRDGVQRLLGYRVTNTIEVQIRDLEDAGELIDAAVTAGGDDTTVGQVAYVVEDDSSPNESARVAAWASALEKGRHLADLSGSRLGRVISISELRERGPQPMARLAMESATTPVVAGITTITVVLEVRFQLE